ncbi:MAG: segregation/condensation protein A [Clostridia bacterium]|nr:segregation/condensation protein A [Clostridia bacterium]MBQ9855955.1 segregation/condensation protein A [Clostridia bacterium]
MAYVVDLKQYEYSGPLDLLLDMISHAKIDIKDIFISEITEQYLESMSQLNDLDMDSASEFLQMAATLLEIKSRALLPKPPVEEDPDAESPEEALIRQLEEYKKFKEISTEMKQLEEEAKSLLTKLPEEYPLPPPTIELTGLTLSGLAKAFARVLKRLEEQAENEQFERFSKAEMRREVFTVGQCMARIQKRIKAGPVNFFSLFEDAPTKEEVITVFLALLELLKLSKAKAEQKNEYSDIIISQPSQAA